MVSHLIRCITITVNFQESQTILNACKKSLETYWRHHIQYFEFLVSVINHYHINGLHLFWDSFEWFSFQISSDTKYFSSPCSWHCDRGLIVVTVYYFQIWNKNIIISWVISSHVGPMYIEIPNIMVTIRLFYFVQENTS